MKKLLWLLFALALLLPIEGRSQGLTGAPLLTTNDWISVPVQCLDTIAGVPRVPDSVHVIVMFAGGSRTVAFSTRNTDAYALLDTVSAAPVSAWLKQFFYRDQIDDIDVADSNGLYVGNVDCFFNGEVTRNPFSFYKIGTGTRHSAATALANLYDLLDGDTTTATNPEITASYLYVNAESGVNAVDIKGAQYGIYIQGVAKEGVSIGSNGAAGMTIAGGSADLQLGSDGAGHIVGWIDSVGYINNVSDQITEVQNYWGAGDGWRQHLMPFGEAEKDSFVTYDGATKKSTVYIYTDSTGIPDSTLQTDW